MKRKKSGQQDYNLTPIYMITASFQTKNCSAFCTANQSAPKICMRPCTKRTFIHQIMVGRKKIKKRINPMIVPIINDFLKDLSLINISSNKFRGNIIQESIPTKTPINITGKLLIESYSITSVCSMSVTGKEA